MDGGHHMEDEAPAVHPSGYVVQSAGLHDGVEAGIGNYIGNKPVSPAARLKAQHKKQKSESSFFMPSGSSPVNDIESVIHADPSGKLVVDFPINPVSPKSTSNKRAKMLHKANRSASTESIGKPIACDRFGITHHEDVETVIRCDENGTLFDDAIHAVSPKNQSNRKAKMMFKTQRSKSSNKIIANDLEGFNYDIDAIEGVIHADGDGNLMMETSVTPLSPRNQSNSRTKKLFKAQRGWITYGEDVITCDEDGFAHTDGIEGIVYIGTDGATLFPDTNVESSPRRLHNNRIKKEHKAQRHHVGDGVITTDHRSGKVLLDGTGDLISATEQGVCHVDTQVTAISPKHMQKSNARKKILHKKLIDRHGNTQESWKVFTVDPHGNTRTITDEERAFNRLQKIQQLNKPNSFANDDVLPVDKSGSVINPSADEYPSADIQKLRLFDPADHNEVETLRIRTEEGFEIVEPLHPFDIHMGSRFLRTE